MPLMGIGVDTFSNLTRAFMASSKLATTGLKSSVKGLSLVTLPKQVDECEFFWKDSINLTYVDDCIILGKDMAIVNAVISLLKEGHEDFKLIDQGSIDKYLGLMIQDIDSNTFNMSQPFLICHILDFLLLDKNKTKGQDTLVRKPLLYCDLDGIPWKHTWFIKEELACSVILLIVTDLRFRWLCIKLHVS
jgi:hypothetical protein